MTPRRGFSLVEILIVVVILGILAAIAIPKFANASEVARENTLKDNLRLLRTQIGVYKSQHASYPGYPGGDTTQTPNAATVFSQFLQITDFNGNVSAASDNTFKWGPYLDQMPKNPISGSADWKILADTDPFTPDGTTGWLYQPSTGTLKANVVGNDSTGLAIVNY